MRRPKSTHLAHPGRSHRPGARYWETWCGRRVLIDALYSGYTGTTWKELPLCISCAAAQLIHDTTAPKEETP